MSVDERAVIAANNNADLYEAIFSSQGVPFERLPFAFVGRGNPPPYYSNLTVLSPGNVDDVVLQIKALAKKHNGTIGLKDSFCQLDLQVNGFDILFGASWIWREAGTRSDSTNWQPVEDEADLLLWEEAWKLAGSTTPHQMFKAEMLHWPDMFFFGLKNNGAFEAGCIANRSANCVGISNVFSRSPTGVEFEQAAATVAAIDRHMPLVGYEAGKNLEYARAAGFETVGDLRILVAKSATF